VPGTGIANTTNATTDVIARVALRLVLATDDELDEVIVETLRTIGQLEGADRAYITQYNDDGTFRNSHEWCADGIVSHQDTIHNLLASDFPYSVAIAERGQILNVGELGEFLPDGQAEYDSFVRFDVHSVLQVPMLVNGRLNSLIGFNHMRSARRWSEQTIEIVSAVADAICVALFRRESDRAIRQARDEAERANRAKDEFLSRISHELRTPLHAILGFTELVRLEQQSETSIASLDQIEESGKRLLTFVEDLLDIGRVASGELQVALGPIPLRFAVERALDEHRSIAATRGVKLVLGPGLADVVVRADEARLAQVLANLVSNALKYGAPDGSVVVDAKATSPTTCRITVTDDGPGLTAEQIDQAFGSFIRLGAERAGEPGMGIGLTLSRAFVEQMHGTLTLDSAPGRGTTAIVTLPLSLTH
jgi:signal transduction histidine kinase